MMRIIACEVAELVDTILYMTAAIDDSLVGAYAEVVLVELFSVCERGLRGRRRAG